MSFDLSRIRFDVRRDFLGVVMQQGRVQLDADWNEWVAQLARRIQAGSLDTYGGNVVPRITVRQAAPFQTFSRRKDAGDWEFARSDLCRASAQVLVYRSSAIAA